MEKLTVKKGLLVSGLAIALLCYQSAFGKSLMPVPVFTSASVQATATCDDVAGLYRYHYVVNNPVSNTGEIWTFRVDVSGDAANFPEEGLVIPHFVKSVPFREEYEWALSVGSIMWKNPVPFGQSVPAGWNGGLSVNAYASYSARSDTPTILPGSSLGGFEMQSYGVPTIRGAQVEAWWVYVTNDHDAETHEDLVEGDKAQQSVIVNVKTLGPSDVAQGSYAHWEQIRKDLQTAITLHWIADAAFGTQLTAQLDSAKQSLDQQDTTAAKNKLNALVTTVQTATASQLNQTAKDLLVLNLQALVKNTPDYVPEVPLEPKLSATPEISKFSIGQTATVEAKLVNVANNQPLAGYEVIFEAGGVNDSQEIVTTNENGVAIFSYQGLMTGIDNYRVGIYDNCGGECDQIWKVEGKIIWSGGVDLVVPLFSPPTLKTAGGHTYYVAEITENTGNVPAAESVTRYYISPNPDHVTDQQVLTQRTVPVLAPGQSSGEETTSRQLMLTIPGSLPSGLYYLSACADADNVVMELNEENNCSYSTLNGSQSMITVLDPPDNQSPLCQEALPSLPQLWPPNHKLVPVVILGVTDPDHDAVTITVTKIMQDEPVNGLGDGDTSPDGFGVGSSGAQLRAERSGSGNGRVYSVLFSADDGKGGGCTGAVMVGVPHDKGKGSTPINDGLNYSST